MLWQTFRNQRCLCILTIEGREQTRPHYYLETSESEKHRCFSSAQPNSSSMLSPGFCLENKIVLGTHNRAKNPLLTFLYQKMSLKALTCCKRPPPSGSAFPLTDSSFFFSQSSKMLNRCSTEEL
jgi:hypothetical protein